MKVLMTVWFTLLACWWTGLLVLNVQDNNAAWSAVSGVLVLVNLVMVAFYASDDF